MKTTYYAWENPDCNGIDPIWVELSGLEFLALVRSAESKGRYFIKLENDQNGTATIIESTATSYLAWKKEKNRREYLKRCAEGKPTVSYHALISDSGGYGEELLKDEATDVIDACLMAIEKETLNAALASLTPEEYRLIVYLYLSDRKGTESEYAALCGVTQKAINKRKTIILSKLRRFFKKDGT